VDSVDFKLRLDVGADVLMPISLALHYVEGDSVPLSHIYPVFQAVFDYVHSIGPTARHHVHVEKLLNSDDCKRMLELVEQRWAGVASGVGRNVGLKANVHLLAFVLDPYAQAAGTTPFAALSH
jgi:hypothetical protein